MKAPFLTRLVMARGGRSALAVLVALAVSAASSRADAANSVADLGSLGSGTTFGRGINDVGQLTGLPGNSCGFSGASIYTGGTMTPLGTLGGNHNYRFAISNKGEVVGVSEFAAASVTRHGFFNAAGYRHEFQLIPLPETALLGFLILAVVLGTRRALNPF